MVAQFGPYEIIRKLGAGGMAEVLLAKHTGIGGFERLVCIKRILPHLSSQEDFVAMFRDEARIAAQLMHPNIAQIYEINQENGSYYIAMEYVRGEDLRRIYNQEVKRGRAIPLGYAAQVIMGAAAALDHAHRQVDIHGKPLGVVHRDVSPQNILVSYEGHVKLVDFGVAKAAGKAGQTRSGVLKGKYSYMSPEQASGDPIDGRSDIFSLGVTLYEVTCGTRLFKRDNELETLQAVIACNVKPPRSLVSSYDKALEDIVMRALAFEPDNRYQSAGDMERDIETYLRQKGHPTNAQVLSEYMRDLFADKLADQALFGSTPWEEPNTKVSSEPKHEIIATSETAALPQESSNFKTEPNVPSKLEPMVARGWDLTLTPAAEEHTVMIHQDGGSTVTAFPQEEPPTVVVEPPVAPPVKKPKRRRRDWRLKQKAVLLVFLGCALVLYKQRSSIEKWTLKATEVTEQIREQALPQPPVKKRTAQVKPAIKLPPVLSVPAQKAAYLTLLAPLKSQVWIGNDFIGETPLENTAIPAGKQRLRLENKEEGYEVSLFLELKIGQVEKLELNSTRGTLHVIAKPKWAWVQIGTKPGLETPLRFELFQGNYNLTIECPNGKRQKKSAAVFELKTTELVVECPP